VKVIYKIRRRSDGLYSKGGGWPNFSAKGKSWPSLGALHAHLNLVYGRGGQFERYADCEIVNIEVVEKEFGFTGVADYQALCVKERQEAAAKKEQKRQARIPKCPHCHQALAKGHAHGGK
jgi:hypothetical protein